MTERKRGSTQWRGCGRAEQQKQTQTLFGLRFIIGTYSINKMQIELSATLSALLQQISCTAACQKVVMTDW